MLTSLSPNFLFICVIIIHYYKFVRIADEERNEVALSLHNLGFYRQVAGEIAQSEERHYEDNNEEQVEKCFGKHLDFATLEDQVTRPHHINIHNASKIIISSINHMYIKADQHLRGRDRLW